MNRKEVSKYHSELGRKSWKARAKNKKKALKHLRTIASRGGKARWRK